MANQSKPDPHVNIEAEEYVCIALLLRGLDAPIELAHSVDASDFFDPVVQEFWGVMVDAYENGFDVFTDPAKMRATIRSRPNASPLMAFYLKMLTEEGVYPDWNFYAREIKNCAAQRLAVVEVQKLRQALTEKTDSTTLIEIAENTTAILSKPSTERILPTINELVVEAAKDTERGSIPLIPTGIDDLDTELSGGIERGEIITIGGIESHGKTALAMHLNHHWSTFGVNGLFISLEMPRELIGRRTLSYHSDVDPRAW